MAIRVGNLVASTGLGVLALCTSAQASVMFTPADIEVFNLAFVQRTFHVSNDGLNPATIVNNNNGPTSISQLLTFDKFDTSLGTLLGVTISFTSDYASSATLSVVRKESDTGSVDFFAEGLLGLLLTGPGLIADQQSDKPVSADCSATPENGCDDNGTNNGSANGSTSGSPLGAFFGPGTFDLTTRLSAELKPRIFPDNGTNFADNSTMDGTLNGSWNGSVSVVYTYDDSLTAVPEPLTLYLLVAGLGGLAMVRRRRA